MAQELVYTSAPRGLQLGSSGFCTVACTRGMPPDYIRSLESLSGYTHVFPPNHPQASDNPLVFSHYRFIIGERPVSVLSRVSAAGVDYTKRSNKFAHHLVLDIQERSAGGPAWVMRQPGIFLERWEGDPRFIDQPRRIPTGDSPPARCENWQKQMGDSGWAGVLAQAFLEAPERPSFIIFKPGMPVLALIDEALRLLPVERRWDVTFSTYFTSLPVRTSCAWRCCLKGSRILKQAQCTPDTLVLDLDAGADQPLEARRRLERDSPLITSARTGTALVRKAKSAATKRREKGPILAQERIIMNNVDGECPKSPAVVRVEPAQHGTKSLRRTPLKIAVYVLGIALLILLTGAYVLSTVNHARYKRTTAAEHAALVERVHQDAQDAQDADAAWEARLEEVRLETAAEQQEMETLASTADAEYAELAAEYEKLEGEYEKLTAADQKLVAEAERLRVVLRDYAAKEDAAKRVAEQAEAQAADKARRVELDRKAGELSRLTARLRIVAATIRRTEAKLAWTRKNRTIYKDVETRHRCEVCGGDGKITKRSDTHTIYERCKNCGGDGTYTTTSRVVVGTRSTSDIEIALQSLRQTQTNLQQSYDAKKLEVEKLRAEIEMAPAKSTPTITPPRMTVEGLYALYQRHLKSLQDKTSVQRHELQEAFEKQYPSIVIADRGVVADVKGGPDKYIIQLQPIDGALDARETLGRRETEPSRRLGPGLVRAGNPTCQVTLYTSDPSAAELDKGTLVEFAGPYALATSNYASRYPPYLRLEVTHLKALK